MKTFKDIVLESTSVQSKAFSYEDQSNIAINAINNLIEYGRSLDIDNKSINPLLDAIKNIHIVGDSVKKVNLASELASAVIPEDKTW